MNKKPIFTKIIIIIVVAIVCLILTMLAAFLLGSVNADIFDFSNLNLSNMMPVFIVGGFISCVIVGLLVIFLAKDIFINIKDYFVKTEDGGTKK